MRLIHSQDDQLQLTIRLGWDMTRLWRFVTGLRAT